MNKIIRNPKRVLVTGGAGFIGSHFVDRAISEKCQVLVLDKLTYAGNLNNLTAAQKSPSFQFIKGDISNSKIVRKCIQDFKPEILVNFAAESHVDRSISNASPFLNTNIIGTATLLEEFRQYLPNYNKKYLFVQISTDEVFGDLGNSQKNFTEKNKYSPSSPYSASKASADHLVKAWARTFNLPILITYCSNNYGLRQYGEKMIPTLLKNAWNGVDLPIYGNGKNIRDWIYVEDHVDGVWRAITRGRTGESYCFGGHCAITNIKLAQNVISIAKKINPKLNPKIKFINDRPGHDICYRINFSKSKKELGFNPKRNKKFFELQLAKILLAN